MRNIIILLVFVIKAQVTFSQTDLICAFNSTHSGRSIILIGAKTINEKNEIGFGVRYNINKIAHNDDQNNSYLKRQYATKFIQHWGVEAFYHRYLYSSFAC